MHVQSGADSNIFNDVQCPRCDFSRTCVVAGTTASVLAIVASLWLEASHGAVPNRFNPLTNLINDTRNDCSLMFTATQHGSIVAQTSNNFAVAVPRACHTATGYAYFRRAVTNSLETRMCAELHLAPGPDTWL